MIEVQRIRVRLGLSPVDMARLFGVSTSTAYRWDSLTDESKIDPRSRALLEWAETRLSRKDGDDWAWDVRRTIRERGDLCALAVFLDGIDPHRRLESRLTARERMKKPLERNSHTRPARAAGASSTAHMGKRPRGRADRFKRSRPTV